MVYSADSKSVGGNTVWVRIPPPAPEYDASYYQREIINMPDMVGNKRPGMRCSRLIISQSLNTL